MTDIKMKVFRGEEGEGELVEYDVELDEGMVLLDCIHRIQHEKEPDLSCRWNCKAGKCGSCSAEINGNPSLMCMTRMSDIIEETPEDEIITVRPLKTFPHVKDLVSDVSWNYEMAKAVVPIRVLRSLIGNSVSLKQNALKNLECVLNVLSAKILVTYSENTKNSMSLEDREHWFDLLTLKCIQWMKKTEFLKSRMNLELVTVTLPNVVLMFVLLESTLPTMRLFL